MNRTFLANLLFALIVSNWAAADDAPAPSAAVTIEHPAPTVELKLFDPANPPADMPKLTPPEAADTVYRLGCRSSVAGSFPPPQRQDDGSYKAAVKVEAVTLRTELSITIWLPSGFTPKLKSHEEGHRKISELFYARSEKDARAVASRYLGKTFTGAGPTADAAADAALGSANQNVSGEYMGTIQGPCEKAQQAYDKITAHGTNDVPEENTIAQVTEGLIEKR